MVLILGVAMAWAGGVDRVPEDFPTLQAALDEGRGDTVRLGPGRWAGATVDRPVHLVGAPGAVIDQGLGVGPLAVGLWVRPGGSGSRIEGVGFDGDAQLDAGIYSSARRGGLATDVAVVGSTFTRCVQGVTVSGPAGGATASWTVEGSVFDGLRAHTLGGGSGGAIGVFAARVGDVDVVGNRFEGRVHEEGFASGGVVLGGCVRCSVVGNTFAMEGVVRGHAAVIDDPRAVGSTAPSRDLVLADNDARDDVTAWWGESYRLHAVDGLLEDGNDRAAWVVDPLSR